MHACGRRRGGGMGFGGGVLQSRAQACRRGPCATHGMKLLQLGGWGDGGGLVGPSRHDRPQLACFSERACAHLTIRASSSPQMAAFEAMALSSASSPLQSHGVRRERFLALDLGV